jgi:hypothetical protein
LHFNFVIFLTIKNDGDRYKSEVERLKSSERVPFLSDVGDGRAVSTSSGHKVKFRAVALFESGFHRSPMTDS